MIDFDKLVLAPCMKAFSEPVIVDPVRSRPGEAPYETFGVYTSVSNEVMLDDGTVLSSQITTLGFQLSALPTTIHPVNRDKVMVRGKTYFMVQPKYDGQGGLQFALVLPSEIPVTNLRDAPRSDV